MERRQVAQKVQPKIGLIGGLARRAGIFYYEQILQRYAAQGETLSLALNHADVSTVLTYVGAGEKAKLGSYLGSLANELFDGGAALVAITAVAPHLAFAEIMRVAKGPVVNVLDVISPGLQASGIQRAAVFGNRAVMETNVFGSIPDQMIVKVEPSMIDVVHTCYNSIALHGKRGTQPERDLLNEAARTLINEGAQAIVLAGTDLSSFYADQSPAYPFLDVGRLHIEAIAERARLS